MKLDPEGSKFESQAIYKKKKKKKQHSRNLLTTEGSVASELVIPLIINPFKEKKN